MNGLRRAAGLLILLVCSVGCSVAAVDKQGAPVTAAITLHLGAADSTDPALAVFVDAVARRSDGRLRADLDRDTYFSETPGGEAQLVPDLRSGRIDLGYLPARDWVVTGDPGFRALQHPFQVTTTQASVTLAGGPAATDLLAGMASYGVVGLGLVPAEPRRLITKEPVLSAADLQGSRIRISDSPETAELISSFGAEPVQGITAADTRRALQEGLLEGVETAPQYISENSYNSQAPYLTTFALIGKFETIAVGERAWTQLSGPDRLALGGAAAETVSWVSDRVVSNESSELEQLCAAGVVLVRPSTAALGDMASAATAAAQADPPTMLAIARLTSAVAGLGPRVSASTLPADCQVATTAEQARTMRASPPPTESARVSAVAGSTIPPGTYRFTVTKEQMAGAGLNGPDWSADVTFTQTFEPDGTFHETQQPDYPNQGPLSGTYVVAGDTVTISYDYTPTGTPFREVLQWSFLDGTLTFTVVSVEDPAGRLLYAQPWRKIS